MAGCFDFDPGLSALQDGRCVNLVLIEADGTVVGRQRLWVDWKYNVANIMVRSGACSIRALC